MDLTSILNLDEMLREAMISAKVARIGSSDLRASLKATYSASPVLWAIEDCRDDVAAGQGNEVTCT